MMEFEQFFRLNQNELKSALQNELVEMEYAPVSKNGCLYAQGTIPVLLIAHLDTVHKYPPAIICYSQDGQYIMSPQGIGGDDRCGVWMIMQILRDVHCHVMFCEDEEKYGRGIRKHKNCHTPIKVNYIVELDRKGANEAVFYGCRNQSFINFILSFGFKKTRGTFSDISILAPRLKTAAINISCGYENAHEKYEYIDIQAMKKNTERLIELIQVPTNHFKYHA